MDDHRARGAAARGAVDYSSGESRDLRESGRVRSASRSLLALLVVYLVLAAQFESFVHPLIIMLTVPLAVLGALAGPAGSSGRRSTSTARSAIIMLVGLAAKNGILIVEFANQLRDEGMALRKAVLEASVVRLRPIMMTSIATVIGAVPLVLGTGAGSSSRVTIGITIVFGVLVSTVLSLLVVPSIYLRLARYTDSPEAVARELEKQDAANPEVAH